MLNVTHNIKKQITYKTKKHKVNLVKTK